MFQRFKAAAGQAAVWTAFSVTLSAAPAAFAAEDKCALKPIVSVHMQTLPSGRVTLPMTLDGRPSHLLLDTGGVARALTSPVVDELGLKRRQSNIELYNVQGRSSRDQVIVKSVGFGGAQLKDMEFFVMGGFVAGDSKSAEAAKQTGEKQADITGREGREIYDGLFTPEMFYTKADVDLDFGANRFVLVSNDHCPGKVVYWPAEVVATIPFQLDDGNHIVFDAKLDGKTVHATLDTGANTSTLDLGRAQKQFDVDVNAADVEKLGELMPGKYVYLRRFKTLDLDGVTINNPAMELLPDAMPTEVATGSHMKSSMVQMPDMLIGMNVLRHLHVYISFRERKLYITPAAKPATEAANTVAAPAADAK